MSRLQKSSGGSLELRSRLNLVKILGFQHLTGHFGWDGYTKTTPTELSKAVAAAARLEPSDLSAAARSMMKRDTELHGEAYVEPWLCLFFCLKLCRRPYSLR